MSAPSHTPQPAQARLTLSARAWTALVVGFTVVVLLLTLTAVTLISQRQRTVLLNHQLGTLVSEATGVIHAVSPLLAATPSRSATVRSRAQAAARLVSRTQPLVDALTGALPSTLGAVDVLANNANRGGLVGGVARLVGGVSRLTGALPAAQSLIVQLQALGYEVQRLGLLPRAAGGLDDLRRLVRLQTRTLRVQLATLATGRSTGSLTRQALATAQQTLLTARQILAIAEQTLQHAASLDRKVGPVP